MDLDDEVDTPIARVQRVDSSDRVVVLEVRVPGQTSVVIVGATRARSAAGLLPRGAARELWGARLPPGSARQRAREESLVGASVLAIGDDEVVVDQRGDRRVVRAQGGRVVVTDAERSPAAPFAGASEAEVARWQERGLELARALADEGVELHRAEIAHALDRARTRIARRRAAIASDLAKIAQADRIGAQAQWLVAEAARAPRGATKLVVTDWSTGEPVPVEVPLDPSKGAREQVEAMFKRKKRLKLGARIADERLAQADAQLAAIERAAAALAKAPSLADIDRVAQDAKRAAPRDVALAREASAGAARAPRAVPGRRTPFRTFSAASGRRLYVGKGAADNDALTLHVARPNDLWVHAKDRTGAHVIVPLDKGQTCPGDDLVDAAHLAAHFSDAREDAIVDVQYTPKRYLRKPKGSPPGFVLVDREKVLALRVEPERVRALLEREES